MPGPRPKPDGERQRRNVPKKPPAGRSVVPAGVAHLPVEPPGPSSHWRPATKAEWRAVWIHPIMAAVDRALHEPELRRLFDLRDEREIIALIVRNQPVVEGSQGQDRMHPLYARLSTVESEIRQLEDRNGLNPKSMLDLGISFGQAKRSLDELAEGLNDNGEDGGDSGEEEDPRKVIDVGGSQARRSPPQARKA